MSVPLKSAWRVFLTACLLALAPIETVIAQTPVETTANVSIWAIEHNSHSPCGGATFTHTAADEPVFVATGGPQWEGCLDVTWELACTESGLAAACTLAGVPDWYQWGRYTWVGMDLACTLAVVTPTEVTASRAFDSGAVHLEGIHDVLLTAPDGSVTSLFGSDPTAASGTRLLEPGTWQIAIAVQAILTDQNLMEYTGALQVDWNTPVRESGAAWGSVKSLYR